jgi:hypothetical protein
MIKYFALALVLICSCKKKEDTPTETSSGIPGGKGGKFHIAVFPMQGSAGLSGKVFIKYGVKTLPSSFNQYDDSSATMTEPGFGPHAHFLSLKPGFYAIGAYANKSRALKNDTLIEVRDTQAPSVDVSLQLR